MFWLWRSTLIVLVGLTTMVQAMTLSDSDYQRYRQAGLDKSQLSYADIEPVLQQHRQNPLLRFTLLGQSALGVPVWQIDVGSGPVKVLAWSQMHGDEPTATAALMDLLNLLAADEQAAWRSLWQDKITLRMIPMLNPDGAAANTRVNSMGIDINRDAKALQTPEGRLLMQAATAFKPHFGLNLHDQNRFYAVGNSDKPATISLLAPAFNEAKDIDAARTKAMQLIAEMADLMQQLLPGYLAKYNDTFSWRSFGDTFAGMGISTVLIESGAHPNDDKRQVARRLNAQLMVMTLNSIASESYLKQPLSAYQAIPFNRDGGMKDMLLTGLSITLNGHAAEVDLALEFDLDGRQQARIRDIGDMSVYGSFHRFDASGLQFQAGRAYALTTALKLDKATYLALLTQGYSHFSGDAALLQNNSGLPVVLNPPPLSTGSPQRQRQATFLLADQDGVKLALLNGRLLHLASATLLNPLGS